MKSCLQQTLLMVARSVFATAPTGAYSKCLHVRRCSDGRLVALNLDQSLRKPTESTLAQCENLPDFSSCLLEIITTRDACCRGDVRPLASVYFKNNITQYWRNCHESPGISNDEKIHLRKNLLLHIQEENPQIALQLAVLVSKIA